MDDTVRAFYDQLAGSYHLIFADWQASITRQAAILDRLIQTELGPGPHTILDCACGIGTQAIGLARLGHRVHATDLSPAAVARAEREATAAGVSLTFGVADMRDLSRQVPVTFDVVLACDNALPHLLTDHDLRLATANIASKLRPGRRAKCRVSSTGPPAGASPSRSGSGRQTARATQCISSCYGRTVRSGGQTISRRRTAPSSALTSPPRYTPPDSSGSAGRIQRKVGSTSLS